VTGDRDRPSWSEIDRRRSGTAAREQPRPRGRHAEARLERATREYVKELDGLFSGEQGGAEGEALAKAVRDAHGTPGLADACRAYREGVGWPVEPALVALFLDSRDVELVAGALEAFAEALRVGPVETPASLRSQIELLADDFDNRVAQAAEDVLELLGR